MMRIIFMGSPAEVVAPLRLLYERASTGESTGESTAAMHESSLRLELIGVVSQPARPSGRGAKVDDPPVAVFAKSHQIKCLQPEKSRSPEFLQELSDLKPDVIITAAYGQILSDSLLAIPKIGTINIHPSRLPEYRGATPVPAALLDGLTSTAVTILFTIKKLDAGNIILQKDFAIEPTDTSGRLTSRLFEASGEMLLETLQKLASDPAFKGTPQVDENASTCKKIDKEMGAIDWSQPAKTITNRYRAFEPWPGSWTQFSERRVSITEMHLNLADSSETVPGLVHFDKPSRTLIVQCGRGAVAISRLKPAGGKDMDAASFWNGLKEKNNVTFITPPKPASEDL
jgi:methionyl-tRNA formyltransferase